MTSAKCPFSTLQAAGITNCQLASQVVRRGGSEFDCTKSEALSICQEMSRQLTKIGLSALGYEDDLVATPKSAYDRALFGGLIGLNDMEMARWENINLTTIHQPIRRIINSSIELVVAMLDDPDRAPEARLFGCNVIERGTLRPIPCARDREPLSD